MSSALCFFHLPGPDSRPESDAQPSDFVFVVPFKYINQAITESIENSDTRFVSLEKTSWLISIDFDIDNKKSDVMYVKVVEGEIVYPERFTVV